MEDYNSPPAAGPHAPPRAADATEAGHWERDVIKQLAMSLVVERRRARRWGIFFKLITLGMIAAIALMIYGRSMVRDESQSGGRHTALVEIRGVIGSEGDASAGNLIPALQSAFKDRNTVGVVLRINSPGGSPVQAGMVYDEIRRLRAKHPEIPLHAVIEDICASGGYYIASAADRIYVDKASLVGSIGVLMDGYGFTGIMEKLGIERRLLTAGANKGFLDSFSPINEEQRKFAQAMLDDIHKQFIDVVRKGRGNRLKESPELFSGLVWTGEQSLGNGLADAYGSVGSVARDVLKTENVVDFTSHDNLAEKLARRLGARSAQAVANWLASDAETPRLR